MSTDLFRWTPGSNAVIVNVPHAGTFLPAAIAATLTAEGLAVPDTDWHVDRLYEGAADAGCAMLVATHSRIVADLNRDPQGATLYPGSSNTEICPTTTFFDAPVYRHPLPAAEVRARVESYWIPYHRKLAAEIAATKARHGFCVLLDAHSIASEVPRFFTGRLPDLNLGTADGASIAPALQSRLLEVLNGATGFTAVCNGRFKGGYITRHYGNPGAGVDAVQLEIGQACYMASPPSGGGMPCYDENRGVALHNVLARVVEVLVRWNPQQSAQNGK